MKDMLANLPQFQDLREKVRLPQVSPQTSGRWLTNGRAARDSFHFT
jgi:hypothetical protein